MNRVCARWGNACADDIYDHVDDDVGDVIYDENVVHGG